MKLRKLIILAVAPMMCLAVSAQDFTPKKGDFTVAATVSYNSYTSLDAANGSWSSHELAAVSTNWTDKKLMVGLEGGWFFQDLWKLTLGGGMNISKNPGYAAVPGVWDSSDGVSAGIPDYKAVASQSEIQFNVYAGVDRYFDNLIKVKNLLPYAGARMGYAYGRNTACADDESWMGKSVGESFNLRWSLVAGLDYFVSEAFFFGIQVEPLAYTYNKSTLRPQEGLGNLSANSHNFGIFAAPTLKVGFKF